MRMGSSEFVLSADAGGEIVPEVHAGPFVSLTDGDGGDAGVFQFLHILQEFGPGGGGSWQYRPVAKSVFVVPETDLPISHGTP